MPIDISFKIKLLSECIRLKEESQSHILAAMDDTQQSANEYGAPKDRYDSFRAQLMRKRDMLAQQQAAIEEDLRYLRQIKASTISKIVEPGALVILNTQILYILAGIGKIEMDNTLVYVISPIVPLAVAMKGLKAGDTFSFRNVSMKILEIY